MPGNHCIRNEVELTTDVHHLVVLSKRLTSVYKLLYENVLLLDPLASSLPHSKMGKKLKQKSKNKNPDIKSILFGYCKWLKIRFFS